ncbi:MAG: hypothetical protein OEW67_10375 [Cyclobacteriaceae bacterium]|nr:hypothetical protein [Cyclobacteriaceae bacterium]
MMDEKEHKKRRGKVISKTEVSSREIDEEKDFGGLPKEIDFRKNIGCGG